MRLWFLSLSAVLAFGVLGAILLHYGESRFERFVQWFGATPAIEFVKSVVADLQSKNFAAVEGKLDPAIVNEQSRAAFPQISAQLPSSPPGSIRLAALSWTRGPNEASTVWHTMVSLEYGIDGKWFAVNARVRTREGEPPVLEGFHFQPLAAPLETINRFTLQGKRSIHYFYLAFLIAMATCTAAAFILCLRQKMPLGRKILWLVGILAGFGKFALNWTSGALQVQLLFINIPAAGVWRASPIAPYIFSFSVPIFAIVFLFRYLPSPRQTETGADPTLPSGL
jgi:hypothetical protein